LVVLRLEGGCLGLSTFLSSFCWWLAAFTLCSGHWLRLSLRLSRELNQRNLAGINCLLFELILKSKHRLDFAKVLLDLEELVHHSHFQLVCLMLELCGVAETLQEYELLIGPLFLDGVANEINHHLLVVECWREFSLLELVLFS